MLPIHIPDVELYDEEKDEIVTIKGQTIRLEHSLVSISKWESKWCKPFLSKEPMSDEEIIDYIKCMTITQNVNPDIYKYMTRNNMSEISEYINAPMTATKVPKANDGIGDRETITSELIYYWMIALQIPVEFQTWHLNRLLALIEVCNFKNKPPKKMSRREILERNRALNAQRRAKYNTKG